MQHVSIGALCFNKKLLVLLCLFPLPDNTDSPSQLNVCAAAREFLGKAYSTENIFSIITPEIPFVFDHFLSATRVGCGERKVEMWNTSFLVVHDNVCYSPGYDVRLTFLFPSVSKWIKNLHWLWQMWLYCDIDVNLFKRIDIVPNNLLLSKSNMESRVCWSTA